MGESYSYCVETARRGRFPGVKAVMFIEADCVPLKKAWLNDILAEWQLAMRQDKLVMGAWLKYGDAGCEHINGNCVMSLELWRICRDIFSPSSKGGWDALLRRPILANGYPSRLIWSDYRLGTSDNPWKGCDYLWEPKRYGAPSNIYYGQDLFPAWYHGIKTMDGLNCVRAKLLE
jgi:hypothetical protein